MYRVILTKHFNGFLRDLYKKGKKGKDAMLKARASVTQAMTDGEITLVSRTKHGESRLPNIEKFDLGDGFRLVVQVANSKEKQRVFLFVGDHAAAEHWLDRHKDHKWVQAENDLHLSFPQVTEPTPAPRIEPHFDLESPETLLALPLLRDLSPDEWSSLETFPTATSLLKTVTAAGWEQDPVGFIESVSAASNQDVACLAIDLLSSAHEQDWEALHARLAIWRGAARIVDPTSAVDAMMAPENSEQFVTWQDAASLPLEGSWADWLLFLHHEQKTFVSREFAGPARLSGVSGSGKTCVIVHRARELAKKYSRGVLVVTLTKSMQKLLEILVAQLCADNEQIVTTTMFSLATDILNSPEVAYTARPLPNADCKREALDLAVEALRGAEDYAETSLAKLADFELRRFLQEEILYIRTRFLRSEYEEYLTIERKGRVVPLAERGRRAALAALAAYERVLDAWRVRDHEGVLQEALEVARNPRKRWATGCRCVLVDEVQDLSQIELRLLSLIPDSDGTPLTKLTDGLFLVGDGTQSIYNKGFSLKNCGISIGNRSYTLKKNYRNTKEIMQAAYSLVKSFQFIGIDEDHILSPASPDFSSRHGERPFLVSCESQSAEIDFVVHSIVSLIEERGLIDAAEELEVGSVMPICVIAFSKRERQAIMDALRRANIDSAMLREEVAWDSGHVKISTVESAKGHEFSAVYIVGLRSESIPHRGVPESEWRREAARLYVGMTRARDQLYLTYSGSPSPFVESLCSECNDVCFKNGQLIPAAPTT